MAPRTYHPIALPRVLAPVVVLLGVCLVSVTPCASASRSQHAAGTTSIELRSSVRANNTPLTIGDVARVSGPNAHLVALVLLDALQNERAASPNDVRTAITHARPDTDWGSIVIRGRACTIVRTTTAQAALPKTVRQQTRADRVTWAVANDTDVAVLLGHIAAKITDLANIPNTRVRIGVDAKDTSILNTPITGRSVQLTCSSLSDKTLVHVRINAGERTIVDQEIRILVELHGPVARTTRPLKPRHRITTDDIVIHDEWHRPSIDTARGNTLENSEIRVGLGAGAIVRTADLRAARVIQRGDIVVVRCLSGTLAVTLRARALADARVGEQLELETLEPIRRDRRRIHAVAQGRAAATITTQ